MATRARVIFTPVLLVAWASPNSTTGSSQCSRYFPASQNGELIQPPTNASGASTIRGRVIFQPDSWGWISSNGPTPWPTWAPDASRSAASSGTASASGRSQRASPKKTRKTWRLM